MSGDNSNDLHRGSFLSKAFGFISFVFLCLSGITLMSKIETYDPISKQIVSSETPWRMAILWFALSLIMSYIAYRFAGGRRNLVIWKDKDLYELLNYAATSGQAKIGFHAPRSQKQLLDKFDSVGIKMKSSGDIRQFIRDTVVMNRRAFDVLREDMCIQMIHKGEVWFWDGYGNRKDAQQFHNSEIIFDLSQSIDHIFTRVLEGLSEKENQ
jgi:hypothetical protein